MRLFAETYPDEKFVQQVVAQIPWFHNCILLDKVKDTGRARMVYPSNDKTGWSRPFQTL
jgi:hypothetical protein